MKQTSCYESDLVELSPEDMEKCYGPFDDIDQMDSFGDTLLLASCKNRQIDNVRLYLSKGSNPNYINASGESPLHEVIDTANSNESLLIEIASMLLDCGADIELRAYMDKTPYLRACSRGSLKMIDLLVKKRGCDTSAVVEEYGDKIDALDFASIFNLSTEIKDYIKNVGNS